MKPQAIVTVGLGFGDEGKGATVDHLCRHLPVDLVVRYSGGSQCGHNVERADGGRHTFSQWGAGTFSGVETYLGPAVVINPAAMLLEAAHLRTLGVEDPFALLHVHPDCLVSTVAHQLLNQARERSRGNARHGSCGHGIGEVRAYELAHGDDAITARDLWADAGRLEVKLDRLRRRTLLALSELGSPSLPRDVPLPAWADETMLLFNVGSELDLASRPPAFRLAVFEGAQGVLLDEWYGFHPHTTWGTVTPLHAQSLLAGLGDVDTYTLGVTRAYATRHGAGPLPTEDAPLTATLVDPGNPENPWQGKMRCGHLDLMLLRYAAAAVRASGPLDGLAVNALDHVPATLDVCRDYAWGSTRIPLPDGPDLDRQAALGRRIAFAAPVYVTMDADARLAALAEELDAPVVLRGHGPTAGDRDADAGFLARFRPRGAAVVAEPAAPHASPGAS